MATLNEEDTSSSQINGVEEDKKTGKWNFYFLILWVYYPAGGSQFT